MNYKQIIANSIKLDGVSSEEILAALETPSDLSMGDLSLPCFKFSKALRSSPQAIADQLRSNFEWPSFVSGVEVVGGYFNIRFNRLDFVRDTLTASVDKSVYKGKTICIDYSSINIAKPFHIGHLLTTAIGGSLYRIYKYLGAEVVGINHLGDWGTQFGKLITAYLKWGSDEDIDKRNINALLDLYVKFHKEAETDASLENEGRMWFRRIEEGDKQALKIFHKFKDVTLKEVAKIYKRLGVEFDSYAGESFYNDKLEAVIDELKEKKLLVDSEGASVVDLSEFDMPPCLILKSDGASLYATRDLAAANYRKKTYNFDKNLYVVAYQQNLHFKQVFKVLELMGRDWASDCIHVPFGMVSLEGMGALSTRSGNVVFLADVLQSAVDKAKQIIEQKNPLLNEKDSVAESVGVGAVVFGALSNSKIKDSTFSLDKSLNFDGETGPYLQYTYARCNSVITKADKTVKLQDVDFGQLVDEESVEVVRALSRFDETVIMAAEKYEPSLISRYLIDLAQCYNKFYLNRRILGEQPSVLDARLYLTSRVKDALKTGLNLILLNAPDKM